MTDDSIVPVHAYYIQTSLSSLGRLWYNIKGEDSAITAILHIRGV